MSKKNIQLACTSCGHVGTGKETIHGNFITELLLLLLVISLFFVFPILGIIALIALFGYSLYRKASKKIVCEKCGNSSLIPTDTPMGKEIVSKLKEKENE